MCGLQRTVIIVFDALTNTWDGKLFATGMNGLQRSVLFGALTGVEC